MPAGSIATRTSRCCTSISCRRRTSRATRTCCAPAAATSRCAARRTRSIRCGRSGRRRGVNRGYQTGVLRADGTLAAFTAVSAPTVYRGDRLPAELRGNVFVVEPAANLVSRIIVSDDGTKLVGAKGLRPAPSSSPSTDERFRPGLSVERARRHALRRRHVSRHHPAPRLHHRVPARSDPRRGSSRRRSATAASTASCTRRRGATRRRRCRGRPSAQLVETLSHPNGWWRDTAQRLLVERGDSAVVPALNKLAASAPDSRDAPARAVDARRARQPRRRRS